MNFSGTCASVQAVFFPRRFDELQTSALLRPPTPGLLEASRLKTAVVILALLQSDF